MVSWSCVLYMLSCFSQKKASAEVLQFSWDTVVRNKSKMCESCESKFSSEGREGRLYSLRLRAVLKIAHSVDGFWLLAGIAVASMEHLGVSFLSTSILGVLIPFERHQCFHMVKCVVFIIRQWTCKDAIKNVFLKIFCLWWPVSAHTSPCPVANRTQLEKNDILPCF